MKFAILLAKGIEGCGVTKYTAELTRWLNQQGHEYTIIASADKKFTRNNSHDLANIKLFKFEKDLDEMIALVNDHDVVLINSLPNFRYSDLCIGNFITLLKTIRTPVILLQHDHSKTSLSRNRGMTEAVAVSRAVLVHSTTNHMAQRVNEPATSHFASLFNIDTKPIRYFQPGFDFDHHRIAVPLSEINTAVHRWVGRPTPWKGFKQMFEFHEQYLQPAGNISIMEGIEKSQAFSHLIMPVFNFIDKTVLSTDSYTPEPGQPIYLHNKYRNAELMQRLARSGFGYQLSILDAANIEHSLEYTHCEIVCSGTIPVFRRAYGERCRHSQTNEPLVYGNNGTVWLDETDYADTFNTIQEINANPELRLAMRERAFNYYKSHQDSSIVFPKLLADIQSVL
jgi:hypothetical protein